MGKGFFIVVGGEGRVAWIIDLQLGVVMGIFVLVVIYLWEVGGKMCVKSVIRRVRGLRYGRRRFEVVMVESGQQRDDQRADEISS